MTSTIIATGYVCEGCANIIANGEYGDDEMTAAQVAAMDAYGADADIVLSGGCPAEDGWGVCLERHDSWDGCPVACLDFSSRECMSCGTHMAGHRCAAVEFARS
jgi:hypothetical protein